VILREYEKNKYTSLGRRSLKKELSLSAGTYKKFICEKETKKTRDHSRHCLNQSCALFNKHVPLKI